MKELSIEQKAKRYDEAIERAKDFMNGEVHYELKIGENIMCWVFPELRESEDERIRKDIISYLKSSTAISPKTWIAWLEKQGEHANFRNKIQIGDNVTRNEDGVLVNLSQLNRVAKKYEKQGEQKPNPCENCSIKTNNCQKFPCAIRNGEQKPAEWSEEDEKTRIKIINFLKAQNYFDGGVNEFKTPYKKEYDWLKSLRPQNKWKPSAFHLECIEDAISLYETRSINAIGLKEILEELKKLRKE